MPILQVTVSDACARVNLAAIAANGRLLIDRIAPRGLLAVVKWNGYGHGLVECARALASAGATALGVSSPADGVTLRRAGIQLPLLVMTDWVGKPVEQFLDYDLHAAATSWYKIEYLEAVSRHSGKQIPVHLKFDTGLGRVGLPHRDHRLLLRNIVAMPSLRIEAIYSHLAFNGPRDTAQAAAQIEIFNTIISTAASLGLRPRWTHLANSAAALALPDYPGNLVRAGIALYGQPPSPELADALPLEPAMALTGYITKVRKLKTGQGHPAPLFWKAPRAGWGAEINLGSNSGYPRSMAGRAPVLFRGRRVRLLPAMGDDHSYIYTGTVKPEPGEPVVFWGRQGGEDLFLHELSPLIDCLPYELPTWLNPSLPRQYHKK